LTLKRLWQKCRSLFAEIAVGEWSLPTVRERGKSLFYGVNCAIRSSLYRCCSYKINLQKIMKGKYILTLVTLGLAVVNACEREFFDFSGKKSVGLDALIPSSLVPSVIEPTGMSAVALAPVKDDMGQSIS
jgi:hypothetical protein